MAVNVSGRSPQGERGLKLNVSFEFLTPGRRSPQGERGLKLRGLSTPWGLRSSLPARGAWIEIDWAMQGCPKYDVAPRKGSVD